MWYSQLGVSEKVYFYMAVISTAILVIQTILAFILGDTDLDADGDIDITDGADVGLRMFSVRGILAFLCLGGWAGLVFSGYGWHEALVAFIAFLFGTAALVGMAFLMNFLLKLQYDGTMDANDAIGKIGSVYVTIPANQAKTGKISIEMSGRLAEMDAVTDCDRTLKSGEKIRVTKLLTPNILIVEPLSTKAEE